MSGPKERFICIFRSFKNKRAAEFMKHLRNFTRILAILCMTLFLTAACAGGNYTSSSKCGKGGWYSKNKNLGPKNKPVRY